MRCVLKVAISVFTGVSTSEDARFNSQNHRKVYWSQFAEIVRVWNADVIYESHFHIHRPRVSFWDKATGCSSFDELYLRQPFHEERRRDLDPDLHPWHLRAVYPPHIHQVLYCQFRHSNSVHRPKLLLRVQGSLRGDFVINFRQR